MVALLVISALFPGKDEITSPAQRYASTKEFAKISAK